MKKFCLICTICKKEIIYKNKNSYNSTLSKKKIIRCGSCARKTWTLPPQTDEHKLKNSISNSGKNNHMYNKTIYDVWLEKYGKEEADKRQLEHAKKSARHGEKNGMFGKSVYDVWVVKYGKEEADRKWAERNLKCVIKGEKNAQYGKPSPYNSGSGWHGSLDGIWFRSLMELYYLYYLIENNIKFECGELKKHEIKYTQPISGNERNYYTDFYLLETEQYIEIKPKNLINTDINVAKFTAAKKKHGDKFVVLSEKDLVKLEIEIIDMLLLRSRLIFPPKILEKYINYKQKHNKEHNTCH
jgi:hypothetical protein